MSIGPEGTFNYTFEIDEGFSSTQRAHGKLSEPARSDRRLVGHSPIFEAVEYQREPWQLYARITLHATDRPNATVAGVSFSVERGLVRVLRPGDVLHLSRTPCGGLGISIIRDSYLVAAAGAVQSVPLGTDVSATMDRRNPAAATAGDMEGGNTLHPCTIDPTRSGPSESTGSRLSRRVWIVTASGVLTLINLQIFVDSFLDGTSRCCATAFRTQRQRATFGRGARSSWPLTSFDDPSTIVAPAPSSSIGTGRCYRGVWSIKTSRQCPIARCSTPQQGWREPNVRQWRN